MKGRVSAVLTFVLVFGALALAQVDGKWAGEFQGGRGPQMVTMTLKADGGKLSGSVTGGRGGDVPVEEGTFANNALKFKTHQMGRGGQVTVNWSGTLKGDEIAMSRTVEGGQGAAQDFVLKRQK